MAALVSALTRAVSASWLRPVSPLLPRSLPSAPLAWCRGIITVDVYQPPERPGQGSQATNDFARVEEVAMSQYNRLVSQEMQRGTLRNGARRMKRFARVAYPHLQRRDAGEDAGRARPPARHTATPPARRLALSPLSPPATAAAE